MDWYTVVESEPEIVPQGNVEQGETELTSRLLIQTCKPKDLAPECQFLIAPFVLNNPDSRTMLPVRDPEALATIENQIVPHFDRCFAFYRGDEPVAVQFSKVKASTKVQFEHLLREGRLNPLVAELYAKKSDLSNNDAVAYPTVIYRVLTERLKRWETDIEDSLSRLIRATFLSVEGHVTVVPNGWTFGEHLLQSNYLGFLVNICTDIFLYVSRNNQNVVAISGHGKR